MYAIMNHEPEKPSNLNPQIPLIFDRILERALKKDPKDRFQRATEIAAGLQDFVESFVTR
jgi:serine/threonine protein kinase